MTLIKRQYWQIKNSKNVLVVYLQIPNDQAEIDDKMLLESHNILKDAFPEQNITLLYFYCNHGRKDVFYRKIQENLIRADFDYDAYDPDVPYAVDNKILQKPFCKLKITRQFITKKNLYRRYIYLTKCFFRGML